MRSYILFLICSISFFTITCKSEPEPEETLYGGLTEKEIEDLGITMEDAVKELTHEPTGVVDIETGGQTVKIDFMIDKWMEYNILSSYHADKDEWIVDHRKTFFDSIPSLGKLIAVYKAYNPRFFISGSSSISLGYPRWEANYISPKLEYALAQECIKDDCNSQTRKVVLQLTIEKQKRKHVFLEKFYSVQPAIQTGAFLMSAILVKENYDIFIKAIRENEDLQVITSLKWPPFDDEGIICCLNIDNSECVIKFAEEFLFYQ